MITAWLQRWGLYLALGGLAVATLGAGMQTVRLANERTAHAKTDQAFSAARSAWEKAARESAEQQREIETLRRQARDRTIDATRTELAQQERAVAGLRTGNDRLRDELATIAARADSRRRDPAATCGGSPDSAAVVVLAELYRGCATQRGDLAGAFEGARTRGLAAEQSYDSLTLGGNR